MLTTLCLLTSIAPAPIPQEDDARAIYGALVAPYAAAQALEVDFAGVFAGSPEVIRAEYRLAKPLFGTVTLYLGDPPKQAVADGTGFYFLDSTFETYMENPAGLAGAPFLEQVAPFKAWLTGKPAEPQSLELVAVIPPNPALRVLKADFGDHTEQLWVNRENGLVAVTVSVHLPSGDEFELSVTFDRIALRSDIDPKDYAGTIPEGYELAGAPEEMLIPAGAEAPDLAFTDLNGDEVSLDGLRGKTVLLNFWFYH